MSLACTPPLSKVASAPAASALSVASAAAALGPAASTGTTTVRRSGETVACPVPTTDSFGAVGPHDAWRGTGRVASGSA